MVLRLHRRLDPGRGAGIDSDEGAIALLARVKPAPRRRREWSALLLPAALALAYCGAGGERSAPAPRVTRSAPSPTPAPHHRTDRHRGISYAHSLLPDSGYGSAASAASLRRLRSLGVDWISITPFGFQRGPDRPRFSWVGDGEHHPGIGETDESLRRVTAQAHELGLRVMLKPHIWLRPPAWPGSIEHRSEDDRAAWFATYRRFIAHYARLANDSGIDALCLGNELEKMTTHEAAWRDVIRDVRALYGGPLTYGAAMNEVFRVPFWDEVDFIGVSAYYPLVSARSPSRAEIAAAWAPVVERLRALAARSQRPIVFTELGYRSADFAAWKQWEIPDDAPANYEVQAIAFEAFFDAVWQEPWMAGVYWWKWDSGSGHRVPPAPLPSLGLFRGNQYQFEGKRAERVVRQRFHE